MKCLNCGKDLSDGVNFCSHCGAEIKSPNLENPTPTDTHEEFPSTNGSATPKKQTLKEQLKEAISNWWGFLSLYSKISTIGIVFFGLLSLIAFLAHKTFAGIIALVGLALIVTALLLRKQIIKTTKKWLHFVAITLAFLMVVPYFGMFSIDNGDAKRINWAEIVLGDVIPEPRPLFGKITSNKDTYLSVYIYSIDHSGYDAYVNNCKREGFVIDADESKKAYCAYNTNGYKLSLNFDESTNQMHICIESAIEYGTLNWPSGIVEELVPMPKSRTGKLSQSGEIEFNAYISNMGIDDYKEYISACTLAGFDIDVNKTDKQFSASNADGYKLTVDYCGNNVIYISLEEPKYPVSIEIECVENWFFSKYDVDVYLDNSFKGTISHGSTETFKQTLKKGSHVLKFVSEENDNVSETITINIQKTESLKCTITCHSSNIDIETIVGTSFDNSTIETTQNTIPTEPTKETDSIAENTEPKETTPQNDSRISMTSSSVAYEGQIASSVESELKSMGFTNVTVIPVITYNIADIDGQVTYVFVCDNSFKKGDKFDSDVKIEIYCLKVERIVSDFELAFIRRLNGYNLYYMFDTDTKKVVHFSSQDTYVQTGTYTGNFNTGVTISWNHGEWIEKFINKTGSSFATMIDAYGFDWEFKACDVATAQKQLNDLQ